MTAPKLPKPSGAASRRGRAVEDLRESLDRCGAHPEFDRSVVALLMRSDPAMRRIRARIDAHDGLARSVHDLRAMMRWAGGSLTDAAAALDAMSPSDVAGLLDLRRAVDDARRCLLVAETLAEDALNVARSDRSPTGHTCDLVAVLEHSLRSVRRLAPDLSLSHSELPKVTVACARRPMMRVIGNIIDNAIVALDGAAAPSLTFTAWRSRTEVFVEIADNGAGLAKSVVERVFAGTTAQRSPGEGLGLLIARTTCQDWGGDLAYRGDERGSNFTLSVPLAGTRDST